VTQEIYTKDYIAKLLYMLKRKGLANDLKQYCVLLLLYCREITITQAYEYLDLSQEDLEVKFNNITNKKEKKQNDR
jgi:hypothetical protein